MYCTDTTSCILRICGQNDETVALVRIYNRPRLLIDIVTGSDRGDIVCIGTPWDSVSDGVATIFTPSTVVQFELMAVINFEFRNFP